MNFYGATAKEATALLKEFGQQLTLSARSAGAYNPAAGVATVSEVTQIGTGALFDYGGLTQINGTAIEANDKRLYLSVSGILPPQVDDYVIASGKKYAIKNVKTIAPAGVAVLYDCLLRC